MIAAVAGGIVTTLLLLSLLALCCLLHRIKCTKKSPNSITHTAQNHETANLDITVNLDVNPSYQIIVSLNDDNVMNDHEYDDIVNDSHILEESYSYVDIDEETTKLDCENLAYVGSTK